MTDSTDNALKPCPFCGSHGIDRDTYWHRDYCTNCGGKGPAAGNSVKAGWNTRADLAPDPQDDPRVKALRGCASMVFLHMSSRDGVCTIPLWVADDLRAALAAFDTTDTGGKADG